MTKLEKYLSTTHQTLAELLAGESQYGPAYIVKLVDQALEENKKIVFISELTEGVDLGKGRYELQPL